MASNFTSLNLTFANFTNLNVTFITIESNAHLLRSILSAFIQVPLGIVGAILCLTAIHSCRKSLTRSTVDPFFINMSIYVLIFSLFFCPFAAYSTLLSGQANFLQTVQYKPLCQALGFVYIEIIMTDVYTYAAIALHRFFAIVLPKTRFALLRSPKCTISLVMAPWILSTLEAVWPLFHLGTEYGFFNYYSRCGTAKIYAYPYYQFLRTFVFFFCGAIVVLCYVAVFGKLLMSRSRIARHDNRNGRQRSIVAGAKMKREVGVTKVVFGLTFIFLVCLLPNVGQSLAARSPAQTYSTLGDVLLMLLEFGE